jgi:O-antigen ligase
MHWRSKFMKAFNKDRPNHLLPCMLQIVLIFLIILLQPFRFLHVPYDALMFLVIAFIIIMALKRKIQPFPTVFLLILGLYTLSILISTMLSVNIRESVDGIRSEYLKQMAVFGLLLITAATFLEKRNALLWGFFLSGVIINTIGFFPYFFGVFSTKDQRLLSLSGSYTRLTYFYVLYVPLLLLLLPGRKRKATIAIYLLIILSLLGTLFTQTRGGWICVPLALISICVLTKNWRTLAIIAAIIALGSVLVYSVSPSIRKRIGDFREIVDDTGSLGMRTPYRMSAINALIKKPLFGAGYGKYIFRDIYKIYKISPTYEAPPTSDSHNTYLEILAQRGIFGFVSTLLVYLFFLKRVLMLRKTGGDWGRRLFEYFIAISIAFAVFGLVDNIYVKESGRYLWQVAALIMISPASLSKKSELDGL